MLSVYIKFRTKPAFLRVSCIMEMFPFGFSILHSVGMGLVGILITVLVAILGAGYFLFDAPGSSLTMENPAIPPVENLSVGMTAIDAAKGVKEMVEQRATETMEQGTGSKEQEAETESPQPAIPTTPAGEENPQSGISIKDRSVSFGYTDGSGRKIDTVVLHSSYNNQGGDRYSVDRVIDIWKSYEVAPHYMIDRKGAVYRLVEDEDVAYHAGNSKMPDGRTNVNAFSIGVEILGDEEDGYTTAQYGAVNDLIAYLKKKHGVKYVVGHADIAPGRKTDPWNFDWKKLQ